VDTLTSYHESGHAVVSFLLGEFPDEVTIEPTDDSAGHMSYLPVESRAIAWSAVYGRTQADRDRVMTWVLSTAAGPAAQALFMRRGSRLHFYDQESWELFDGGSDYRRTSRLTARLDPVPDLEDAVEEAFDILETPGVWAAVEFLAKDLMRFRTLDYQGIEAAIYYRDAIRGQTIADRLGIDQRTSDEPREHTRWRRISHEEAWRKIAAKSPLGALQVAAWRRAAKHGPELERR
jgi:hypothetical protein